jgi:Flp pilus assembly pilin Flp
MLIESACANAVELAEVVAIIAITAIAAFVARKSLRTVLDTAVSGAL